MVKLFLARGPVIATVALIVLVIGATLFDNSYQNVEPILKTKYTIANSATILPNQSVNYTVSNSQLKDHNVVIVHSNPLTQVVKLIVVEPNGMTFEKESKDGFLYHIIQKNTQVNGYVLQLSNEGQALVQATVIVSEDPFLSGHCTDSDWMKCNMVNLAMGFVITGIIGFIVGILIGISDFKKERKLQK